MCILALPLYSLGMRRVLFRFKLVFILSLATLLLVTGCSSVAYYGQSVFGHTQLMLARKPLPVAIDEARRKQRLDTVDMLELAEQLRNFSITELSLPDNGSYTSYVDLEREFPVWTVVAAEEFSIEPVVWCYLVIGCASYRGYFARRSAEQYAKKLRAQGFETSVGGAPAYSTLGWFDDPLLPSMMRYGEADLAQTLFHELAHQVLYIENQTALNEAFATVVGEQGALRWLRAARPHLTEKHINRIAALETFTELISRTKRELNSLYHSQTEVAEMRQQKMQLFASLENQYRSLKNNTWQGQVNFDAWFEKPINNARMAAFGTYREQVPALRELLKRCGEDFARFFTVLKFKQNLLEQGEVPVSCEE